MTKKSIDLRTPLECSRDELNAKICAEYEKCRVANPTAKPYRIFAALANKFGRTQMGVANIIRRNGLYTAKTAQV